MTVVVALLTICVCGFALIATIAFLDRDRDRNQRNAVMHAATARMEDLDAYRSTTQALVVAFANTMTSIAARDTDQHQQVITALISDRERLVTAVLALPGPAPARVLGMVDQANAAADRAGSIREFLEQQVPRDTAYATSDGDPIVPVGMAGA